MMKLSKRFFFGVTAFAAVAGAVVVKNHLPPTVITDMGVNFTNGNPEVSAVTVCRPKLFPIPFVSQECDSTLSGIILNKLAYQKLTDVLEHLNYGDVLTLHLTGNGGNMEGEEAIENAIRDSSAHVITSAEGDVYSAHAFLTIIGDEVRLAPNINLLFHRPAMGKQSLPELLKSGYCESDTGTDRGQSAKGKCLNFLQKQIEKEEKWMKKILNPFLKQSEIQAVLDGYDVIIDSDVINARLGK